MRGVNYMTRDNLIGFYDELYRKLKSKTQFTLEEQDQVRQSARIFKRIYPHITDDLRDHIKQLQVVCFYIQGDKTEYLVNPGSNFSIPRPGDWVMLRTGDPFFEVTSVLHEIPTNEVTVYLDKPKPK